MTRSVTPLVGLFGLALIAGCAGCGASRARAPAAVAQTSPPEGAVSAEALQAAGYTKPRMVVPGCVQRSIRIPRDLEGVTGGPYTVKFVVLADGRVHRFQMMTIGAPEPLTLEVKRAIESCEWKPGTDRDGRPAAIWVLLPLRFAVVPASSSAGQR